MADKILPNATQMKFLSSNSDPTLMRTLVMPNVDNRLKTELDLTFEPENRINKAWIDPLSPIMRKLRRIRKEDCQRITYTGQLLTTLSYQLYNTTSLWYPMLYVSGFTHPQEIPHGAVLYAPTKSMLEDILKIKPRSRRGEVVRT